MTKWIIRRVTSRPDGVGGVLLLDAPLGALPICVTLEDPWRNNAPMESCIPAGAYVVRPVVSPKFGPTFEITGVPGRSHILFHTGNTEADTHGCVLVGSRFSGNLLALAESRIAFNALLATFGHEDEIALTIEDCWGDTTTMARLN